MSVAIFYSSVQFELGWTIRDIAGTAMVTEATAHYWRRIDYVPLKHIRRLTEILPDLFPKEFFMELYEKNAKRSQYYAAPL